MKYPTIISIFLCVFISSLISSCAAIEGIFKAGMGFGIFAVIAVILLIIFIITRLGKSKSS